MEEHKAGPAVSEEVAGAHRQRCVEIDGCLKDRTRLIGLLALSFYGSIQSQDAKKRTQIRVRFLRSLHFQRLVTGQRYHPVLLHQQHIVGLPHLPPPSLAVLAFRLRPIGFC